jgi:hypothetical protein
MGFKNAFREEPLQGECSYKEFRRRRAALQLVLEFLVLITALLASRGTALEMRG